MAEVSDGAFDVTGLFRSQIVRILWKRRAGELKSIPIRGSSMDFPQA